MNARSVVRAAEVLHKREQANDVGAFLQFSEGCMLARLTRLALAAVLAALAAPAVAGPALLFDAADGRVLYAEDADNQWHPASLTKIMTAYVTFEALKEGKLTMASKIGCSELANSQSPSKIGLPVGAEMTVETALQTLIVKSANDVAVMLAEAVSGSQEAFVERMNATAARLGMTRTKFVNANGLPAPGAGDDGARPGEARLGGAARLSRACAALVDAGGAASASAACTRTTACSPTTPAPTA